MDFLKILKCLVFIISFVMFVYQLNIATINLVDPPTVLSQYERAATFDDMPLITVCPTNHTNLTRIKKLGYSDYDRMLLGTTKCNETTWCTSWGKHLNLTFDELREQVFDLKKVKLIYMIGGRFSPVFIPGYGVCKESSLLNYTQEIELGNIYPEEAMVFITDKNYRRDNCKDEEISMSENDFKKCVDDKIQKEFERKNISCVHPWLSYNKQCNQTYPETFYGKFYADFKKNYVDMVGIMSNIRFEEECRQSCKETIYVVNEKGSKKYRRSTAYITFNHKVIVTEKVPNYDLFKYIIDVGSSLGLWLGLSVLGLHDLVVWAVQFVNNIFIINKIRSAVTR